MYKETLFASYFLNFLIKTLLHRGEILGTTRNKLKSEFARLLRQRYKNHWFPKKPYRDSNYRCVKFDGELNSTFTEACKKMNVCPNWIHWKFLDQFAMWINPGSITIQINPKEDLVILYSKDEKEIDNFTMANIKLRQALVCFNVWRCKREKRLKQKCNM